MPTETDDFEDNLCPMCLEELDITDRNFKPCQCGYQVENQRKDNTLINHSLVHVLKTLILCLYRCVDFVGTTLKRTLMGVAQHAVPYMMQITTNLPLQIHKSK
jgi:hypothetical protein